MNFLNDHRKKITKFSSYKLDHVFRFYCQIQYFYNGIITAYCGGASHPLMISLTLFLAAKRAGLSSEN